MARLARALVLLISPLVAACVPRGDAGPLAIGALYRGFEDTSSGTTPASYYYLRFIDEETVLNTASDQDPAQVRAWFRRGEPNVNSEDYELDGSTITINYNLASTFLGTIDGEQIFFEVTLADGATYNRNFALVK